jgi:hypothetical protein
VDLLIANTTVASGDNHRCDGRLDQPEHFRAGAADEDDKKTLTSARSYHSLALKTDGSRWAWGLKRLRPAG